MCVFVWLGGFVVGGYVYDPYPCFLSLSVGSYPPNPSSLRPPLPYPDAYRPRPVPGPRLPYGPYGPEPYDPEPYPEPDRRRPDYSPPDYDDYGTLGGRRVTR